MLYLLLSVLSKRKISELFKESNLVLNSISTESLSLMLIRFLAIFSNGILPETLKSSSKPLVAIVSAFITNVSLGCSLILAVNASGYLLLHTLDNKESVSFSLGLYL